MGQEIERKFLVIDESWREGARSLPCRQGYLSLGPPVTVRIRLMGGRGTLNIKQSTLDVARAEFEYPVPPGDAEELLGHWCIGDLVEKTRHYVEHGGMTWEIDEFDGANRGLVVAEIELEDPDQEVRRPSWAGREVSGDPRYLNSNLSRHPYSEWSAEA